MEAEVLLSHLGTETVLAKTGPFDAPLSGFTALGYLYPRRVTKQVSGVDPAAVAGDQLILRVKRVSGGTIGFVYLREAVKGTSSLALGQSSSAPINSNGGFEQATLGVKTGSDVSGWEFSSTGSATFRVVEDPVKEGNRALSVEVAELGTNSWSVQAINTPFSIQPATQYTYAVWAKTNKAGAVVAFTVGDPTYNEWGREQVVLTTTWQLVMFAFTTSSNATSGRAPIHFSGAANASYLPVTFYIDEFQITKPGMAGVLASVTTSPASSVGTSYATLNGRVNPMGAATNAWFEYGISSTLSTYSSTSTKSIGSGTTSQSTSTAVSGLSLGTKYYFRAAASNVVGTSRGSIENFTTSAILPALVTWSPASVHASGATLNGSVNPSGTTTSAWFEYGIDPTLSIFSSTPTQIMGSGTTLQPISAVLSRLTQGTTYYFRLVASNAAGIVRGSPLSFTTLAGSTSVEKLTDQMPEQYELDQNYPNPFNPSTVVEYALPREESVILTVFNSLGQAVEVLVNERKHAGRFRFIYDAGALPSGVYFYRLQAGLFSETKKLLLLR